MPLPSPLPQVVCLILPKPTETPPNQNPYHVLHQVSYYVLLIQHHRTSILKTKLHVPARVNAYGYYQQNAYGYLNALFYSNTTPKKTESSRAASISMLSNNNSIINTKPLLFPSPCLFIQLPLQYEATTPSSISTIFHLCVHKTIPTVHATLPSSVSHIAIPRILTKNVFPYQISSANSDCDEGPKSKEVVL